MEKTSNLDFLSETTAFSEEEILNKLDDDFNTTQTGKQNAMHFIRYLRMYFEAYKYPEHEIAIMGTSVAIGDVNKIVNHIIANSVNKSAKWMQLQCNFFTNNDDRLKRVNTILERVEKYQYGIFSNGNTRFYCSIESAIKDWYIYGTACIQIKYSKQLNSPVFINVLIDDISFDTNEEGAVNQVFRDIKLPLRRAYHIWGDKLHENQLREMRDVRGNHKKECRYREYIVLAEYCHHLLFEEMLKFKYVRIIADTENKRIVEISPLNYMPYIISRFAFEAGSAYGKSELFGTIPVLSALYETAADIRQTSKMLAHPAYLVHENPGFSTISPSDLVLGLGSDGNAKVQPFHVHNQNIGILYEYYQSKKAEFREMLHFDMLMLGINPNETATAIQAKKAQAVDALSPMISTLESEFLNPLIKNMILLLLSEGHSLGLIDAQGEDNGEDYLMFRDEILPFLDVYCVGETKQIQNMYVLQNMLAWYGECLKTAEVDPSFLKLVKFPQLVKKIGELRGADESLTRSDAEAAELEAAQRQAAEEQRLRQQTEAMSQEMISKMNFDKEEMK